MLAGLTVTPALNVTLKSTCCQFALSVTVPDVFKSLKYVFVVAVPSHAVVGFAEVPVLALAPSPVDVHPVNIYPALVGLSIKMSSPYLTDVGAFVPAVPPSKLYEIVYGFPCHSALICTVALSSPDTRSARSEKCHASLVDPFHLSYSASADEPTSVDDHPIKLYPCFVGQDTSNV